MFIDMNDFIIESFWTTHTSYVYISGIILIVIVISILIHTAIHRILHRGRKQQTSVQQTNSNDLEYENQYEEIEENVLERNLQQEIPTQVDNLEINNTDAIENKDDGYLDPVVHYMTPKLFSQTSENSNSGSVADITSDYLYPYMPILKGSAESHEYTEPYLSE